MQDTVNALEVIQSSEQCVQWPRVEVDWSDSRRKFFAGKYSLERYAGLVMLVGFSPVIGSLWLLVRGTSRGPGFFRQVRVGLNGEPFELIKLRSMCQNAEQTGQAIWCQQSDQRITWLGCILRKLHLDELPQLWNVAKGEMTLIGPRPERPSICEKLAENIDGYYDRVLVKPGISGLSQINLPADQTLEDVQRKQVLDLNYINETNQWLEYRILLATCLRIVGLKGETIIRLMRLCRRSLIETEPSLQTPCPTTMPQTLATPAACLAGVPTAETPLRSFFARHFPELSPRQEKVAKPATVQFSDRATKAQPTATEYPKRSTSLAKIKNCMTVDVEDYFQVSAFADRVTRSDWDRYECRVEVNTNRVLNLFEEANVQGTFFILGWVADRYPSLVKRITAAGHEIASHGYWHQLVYDLTPQQFADDVTASRDAIYNACGVEVTSYRAPSFSIVPRSRWALQVLAELGFQYDSSVFPMSGHDRYGDPDAPKRIHRIQTDHGELVEFPPTVGHTKGFTAPIGGGYFRLLPLKLTQLAIDDVRRRTGPAMFYFHPWELDPNQPRLFANASRKSRFRHYVGLKHTERKIRRVLQTNGFDTMTNVIHATMQPQPLNVPVKKPQLRLVRRKKATSLPVEVGPATSHANSTIH